MTHSSLRIFAGPSALRRIELYGLQAADVAVIPAAAGGPKGLILQKLDQWLFGSWLASSPAPRTLIGASIGSWRMAAAACADPVAGFQRLGDLYCGQTYPENPDTDCVTREISGMLDQLIGGYEQEILSNPAYRLHILTNRGLRHLQTANSLNAEKTAFARAALANLRGRNHLAAHLERVVFSDQRDSLPWLTQTFDAFSTVFTPLQADNLRQALLASGTLPLIMNKVSGIPAAPQGQYWDGGIIDYHLAFPYHRLGQDQLVLYPHFAPYVVPGWLDKALPWRRAHRTPFRGWMDNVILLAPSADFLRSLPRGKLPDRKDFAYHGLNHQRRIQDWKIAMSEAERLRDDLIRFIEKPDLSAIQPL